MHGLGPPPKKNTKLSRKVPIVQMIENIIMPVSSADLFLGGEIKKNNPIATIGFRNSNAAAP
jgi:hypothetical protein